MSTRVCSVEGCGDKHWAKGLCRRCYMRAWHRQRTDRTKPPTPPATHRTAMKPRRYV